ncbi:hypothetical protein EAI_04988 [Harpegnathos saltator]|uniref:Uncharacterized protein n=1 Tax=Harpegnathos saltator TaxID=610380 RepID=E2C179_HARSA|nr:hypothetical protein EAI_04988 [Harpegnathos saltator]
MHFDKTDISAISCKTLKIALLIIFAQAPKELSRMRNKVISPHQKEIHPHCVGQSGLRGKEVIAKSSRTVEELCVRGPTLKKEPDVEMAAKPGGLKSLW